MEGEGENRMERFDDSRIFPALFLPYRSHQASLMKAHASMACASPMSSVSLFISVIFMYLPVFVHMVRLWELQIPYSV